MDFSDALKVMKEGKKVTRKGLRGKWIAFEKYSGWRYKTVVMMKNDNIKQINYDVSNLDLLAEDWTIYTTIEAEQKRYEEIELMKELIKKYPDELKKAE